MYHYAFNLNISFTKEVTLEDIERALNIKSTNFFPRDLNDRGVDTFYYQSINYIDKEDPYIDETLEAFVKEIYPLLKNARNFLKEKEAEISICILYDNEEDEDTKFEGYAVNARTIKLLAELDASLDYCSYIAL